MDVVEKLKLGVATDEEKNEIAKQYLNVIQHYSNGDSELFSAGLAGLEFAIRNAARIREDNLRGWIFLCVTKFVSRAREQQCPHISLETDIGYSHTSMYEDICEICQNSTELKIVQHRVAGYKDDEIAVEVGLSQSHVHRIRMRIKVRFEDG